MAAQLGLPTASVGRHILAARPPRRPRLPQPPNQRAPRPAWLHVIGWDCNMNPVGQGGRSSALGCTLGMWVAHPCAMAPLPPAGSASRSREHVEVCQARRPCNLGYEAADNHQNNKRAATDAAQAGVLSSCSRRTAKRVTAEGSAQLYAIFIAQAVVTNIFFISGVLAQEAGKLVPCCANLARPGPHEVQGAQGPHE